jgi:hypothetical protein
VNHFNDHRDEFPNEDEFLQYRSRFGGLLLVPASFNRSYGDKPYERKVGPYFGQNLLAKSLSTNCYSNQPKFLQFVRETGLPFQAHDHFRKADLDQRQELYRLLCERIWDPARLDQEAGR